MASAIVNTLKIDAALLKRISKMHESGMSIREISNKMNIDQPTTIRLLRLSGYNTGVLEETWLTN